MLLLLTLGIAVLTACGVWLLLRARSFPVVLGLTLLSYAVNLFLFATGRLVIGLPPVIVGGGASGVYMANRLVEEFKKQGQPPPVIALAERSDDVGGRLMSARGSGGLGLAVDQLDAESKNIPPEEYGGMRIDPYRYRLVWDKIIEFGQAIYGEDQCLKFEDCLEESVNCCAYFGGGWWRCIGAGPAGALF